jgi:hypothetical protein
MMISNFSLKIKKNDNMKTIHFFCRRVLWGLMAIILVACSNEGNLFDENLSSNGTSDSKFTYTMHLTSDVPSFDEASGTRSSASWADGSTIYMCFNGVYGTAVYKKSSNTWTVTTVSSLSATSTSTDCYGIYAENLESETSTAIYTSVSSPFYFGKGTYTYSASSGIIASINMVPDTWRLRFKGSSGTMISVSSSDVNVYKTVQKTDFSKYEKDPLSVTLTVGNDGYTPYIYGLFAGTTTDIALTVSTTEGTFTRTIDGSSLNSGGASAYLDVPTENSHDKWNMEQIAKNCAVKPDFYVPMTDRVVTNFEIEDNVYQFTYSVLSETVYNMFTDENQLVNYISSEGNVFDIELKDYEFYYAGLDASTKYYLVSFGYNSNGVRGEVTVTPFTTRSLSLPIAEITAVDSESSGGWKCSVSLKNNAVAYYAWAISDYYDIEDCFYAYDIYWYISKYTSMTRMTSSYFRVSANDEGRTCVITIAMDVNGNLGNPSIARATSSSSAAQRVDATRSAFNRISVRKKPTNLNFLNITTH